MIPVICFPAARVVEVNALILAREPGLKGTVDIARLQGALGRIEHAIAYTDLDDVFDIAAKYAASIAIAHAFPDANKRTGLAVALEYLLLNDFELRNDNELLANAIRDMVVGELKENDLADLLYAQYIKENTLV